MTPKTSPEQTIAVPPGARAILAFAILLGVVLGVACGRDGVRIKATQSEPSGEPDSGPGPADAGPEALNDGQILQVLQSANLAEITLAQFMSTNATTVPTATFANQVGAEDTAANARLKAITAATGIAPAPSAASKQVDTQGKLMLVLLNTKVGLDVDKTYVHAQVLRSQQLATMIDDELVPRTTNAQLKAELQSFAPVLQQRAAAAQALLRNLETIPLPPTPPPAPDGGTPLSPDAG